MVNSNMKTYSSCNNTPHLYFMVNLLWMKKNTYNSKMLRKPKRKPFGKSIFMWGFVSIFKEIICGSTFLFFNFLSFNVLGVVQNFINKLFLVFVLVTEIRFNRVICFDSSTTFNEQWPYN